MNIKLIKFVKFKSFAKENSSFGNLFTSLLFRTLRRTTRHSGAATPGGVSGVGMYRCSRAAAGPPSASRGIRGDATSAKNPCGYWAEVRVRRHLAATTARGHAALE